jgi:hypothetical protein
MIRNNWIVFIISSALLLSGNTHAQTVKTEDVMEITQVAGNVIAERIDGSQYPVRVGSIVSHGSKVLVTAGSKATGMYLKNKCEITYTANTVVNVRSDKPCSPGVAVINANKYAKFGNGANPGCCVTRTITVPAPAGTLPVVTATTGNSLLSGSTALAALGGVAVLALLINDDDDNDGEAPASK